jgi:hypothetical protein
VTTRQRKPTARKPKAKPRPALHADVIEARAERLATALKEAKATVDRPHDALGATDVETLAVFASSDRALRERLGGEYIAAIGEQRPGVDGHGYPGGHADWDTPNRLDPLGILPEWFALPIVRKAELERQQVISDTPELG